MFLLREQRSLCGGISFIGIVSYGIQELYFNTSRSGIFSKYINFFLDFYMWWIFSLLISLSSFLTLILSLVSGKYSKSQMCVSKASTPFMESLEHLLVLKSQYP